MAFHRHLPLTFDPDALADPDLADGGVIHVHRYPGGAGVPHTDTRDCWCAPLVLTGAQRAAMRPKDVEEITSAFLCVH